MPSTKLKILLARKQCQGVDVILRTSQIFANQLTGVQIIMKERIQDSIAQTMEHGGFNKRRL